MQKINGKKSKKKVAKKETNEVAKMGFFVEHSSFTEVVREADPEDEWSGEDTETTHSVGDLIPMVGAETRFNCVGNFTEEEFNKASRVFVVYLIYSTGDSFSQSNGYGIEFIQAFISEEKAIRCVLQIQSHHNLYKEMNSYSPDKKKIEDLSDKALNINKNKLSDNNFFEVFFQDEKGDVNQCAADWNGYFENLDMVTYKSFELKLDIKKEIKSKL